MRRRRRRFQAVPAPVAPAPRPCGLRAHGQQTRVPSLTHGMHGIRGNDKHIPSVAHHFPVLQANCHRSLHDHRYDIMPYMVMGAKVLINILRQHELDWVFITLIISHTAFTPILLTNNYLFTYSNR